MKKRFSKSSLLSYLEERIKRLETSQGFVSRNGYAQVQGKGEEKNRLYGEYAALWRLVYALEEGDL